MNFIVEARKICQKYRDRLKRFSLVKLAPSGKNRVRGISISDLHCPFQREDLIRDIVKKHGFGGVDEASDFCVINGDLFDNYLISKFPKRKEIPFIIEYQAASLIVRFLAQHFKNIYLVDGNHDYNRYMKEIQRLNPTIQFLAKSSPLKYLADGNLFTAGGNPMPPINLQNVFYAGDLGAGWWLKLGKTIFCHRLRGFRSNAMQNATYMVDHFAKRGVKFQCLVAGHSHRVGQVAYTGGKLVIDQGALCYPLEYEDDGSCHYSPPDLGYAIVSMDQKGNVDPDETKVMYLGTYQEGENED